MTKESFMDLLLGLGWDEWSDGYKSDFCMWCAALLNADKTGLTGDARIPYANRWLADQHYKPLPFCTLPKAV